MGWIRYLEASVYFWFLSRGAGNSRLASVLSLTFSFCFSVLLPDSYFKPSTRQRKNLQLCSSREIETQEGQMFCGDQMNIYYFCNESSCFIYKDVHILASDWTHKQWPAVDLQRRTILPVWDHFRLLCERLLWNFLRCTDEQPAVRHNGGLGSIAETIGRISHYLSLPQLNNQGEKHWGRVFLEKWELQKWAINHSALDGRLWLVTQSSSRSLLCF